MRYSKFKTLFCSEYGRSLSLISFINNQINMRRIDGALVSCSITPYCEILHGFVASNKWDDALRICRFVNVRIKNF